MVDSAHILVIDNYDSFVYTIVGYLQTLGARTTVVRNDTFDVHAEGALDGYDGVLISPGPGTPREAGVSEDVIRLCIAHHKPMFGVCLGLQALAEVYGATVEHAPHIMHGKTSQVQISDDPMFEGIASPMTVTRYHSLAVNPQSIPSVLEVTAVDTEDHTVQALRVKGLPLSAVQFHPESVMTKDGFRLFANFLAACGQSNAVTASLGLAPKVADSIR